MSYLFCRCPCPELRCCDPSNFRPASEAEQVALVAQIGLVAAALDGGLTQRKGRLLEQAIRLLPGMGRLSDSSFNALVATAVNDSERGAEWLCETTHRIRSVPLRRVAFRLAALLTMSERELDEQQQGYLVALASGFGFNDGEVARLVTQALDTEALV